MISDNLTIGEKYNLILGKKFGGLELNVNVIGKTKIDLIGTHDDKFNVYETYYKPNGLALTTYFNTINSDTVIYICNPLTSLEPLTIDNDTKLFIPESIFDSSLSSLLVPVSLFNINISNVHQRYTTNKNRDDFIEELLTKTRSVLRTLIEYNISDNDIKQINDIIYLRDDEMEKIEETRHKLYMEYQGRVYSDIQTNMKKVSQYNKLIKQVEETQIELQKELELNRKINQYLQDQYNVVID